MQASDCPSTSYVGDGPTYCDGTSEKQVEDGSDGTAEQAMSEKYLKYVARDFFVVMPVGANLDQLESNGYFDGSTTYKPYADRPYLIRRDNSAYPEIKATNDAFHRKPNPYAPGTNMQPFKKAPNAHNVYYLVEQPVDFSQFKEATVSGGRQGDGSDSSPDDGISSDGNGDDATESDDSSQSQSSQSGARTYTNARFSYRVDVPAGYKWQQESDNGDGRKFDATSGSTQISVWGSNNALSHSPQEELDWLKENLAATRTYRSRRWPANRCTSAMSRTEPSRISAKSSPEGRSRPSKSRIRPANAQAETNSRRRFR